MPRIFVAVRAASEEGCRDGQWIDADDVDAIRRKAAEVLHASPQEGAQSWRVLAYDGLPDFGPNPDVNELLAFLDADYGEPLEKLWASRRFERVIQAADAFADTYRGTYPDAGAWARHYFALIVELAEARPDFDFDAYGREAAAKGDVQFIAANGGSIHVFWND